MKTFLKNYILSLAAGLCFILILLVLESFFHYPARAFLDVLLPVYGFAFYLYLPLAIPALIFWALGARYLEINAKSKGPAVRFLALRMPAAWSFSVLLLCFWLIEEAGLSVGLLFYFFSALLATLFVLLLNQKGVLIASAVTVLVLFFLGLNHFFAFRTAPASVAGDGVRPNVLLLVSDTTRRDHLGFYNYFRKTTPHMTRLAGEGVVFEGAHSTSSWTKPATASLLTGRFLTEDPVHRGPSSIRWSGLTMPQFFRARGYETVLFSANSNASSYFGHAKGFARRVHSLPPPHMALQRFVLIKFFNARFQGKTALTLKNIDTGLEEFQKKLKLDRGRISDFVHGRIKAGVSLTPTESFRYRKRLRYLIARKASSELRYMPGFLPRRKGFWFSYMTLVYKSMLKFYYFKLEGAQGEIVEHWIKDAELKDRFIRWVEGRSNNNRSKGNRPFFAHVQIMGPHTPYLPQLPHLLPHFDPDYKKIQMAPPTQHTPPSVPAPVLTPRKLFNLKASYDNSLRITDANLYLMIQSLKKRGLLENTIIVYVADHGEAFYEHFIYGHMNSLHRELTEIPLFFYWKGRLKPGRISRPASITDLYPTLATLCGYGPEVLKQPWLEGRSLFQKQGASFGDAGERKFLIKMATLVGGAWKLRRQSVHAFGTHMGVLTDRGKLIYEDEENGRRYFFFAPSDKEEKRIPLSLDDASLPAHVRELIKLLPAGPGR